MQNNPRAPQGRCVPSISLLASISLIGLLVPALVLASCPEGFGGLDPEPNVSWTFRDSVAACPGGDSLVYGSGLHNPSQLRIVVTYLDDNCDPRVGVPPESIYVVVQNYSGNARANDQPRVYADDSTNSAGQARITVRSLSGNGRVRFRVFVSGVEQDGYSTPTVRTPDTDADGQVTTSDLSDYSDLNYDGSVGLPDLGLVAASIGHTHRHALFGTPVRRTNLGYFEYGAGRTDWEPNGQRIAYSAHIGQASECKILLVPSSPTQGNVPFQFTFNDSDDYDPSWSPRGHEIAFDRSDRIIYRKGIPGIAPDTSLILVTAASESNHRTVDPAFAPNGRRVCYARITTTAPLYANLYLVNLPDGQPQQLTFSTAHTDRHPRWSPDGQWIYFDRVSSGEYAALWKVNVASGDSAEVLSYTDRNAANPAPSPDGAVLVARVDSSATRPGVTHVLAADSSNPPAIPNYGDYSTTASQGGLFPILSSDGTRLAFVAPPPGLAHGYEQVWTVRRNMDLPPALTSIGDKVVEEGQSLSFSVSVSDPESDATMESAHFLEPGMSFSPATGNFSWTPGNGTAGNSYWVKFLATEASGGCASEVVKISVIAPGLRSPDLDGWTGMAARQSGNPSGGPFVVLSPKEWTGMVDLSVYDVGGHLVFRTAGRSGDPLSWDGKRNGSTPVPGVYFYVIRWPKGSERGKWVLVR